MRLPASTMASVCLVLGFFLCFLSSNTTPYGTSTGTGGTFTLAEAAPAAATSNDKAPQKAASHPNTRGGAARRVQVEVDAEGEMEGGGEEAAEEEEEEAGGHEEEEEDEEEGDYEEEDEDEEDDGEEDEDEDEEEDDEEEEKPVQEPYIVDDVASEDGDLRGTLILDEISEYTEVDEEAPGGSTKYFKTMLHLYNSGFVPICGITVEISPNQYMDIEQLWTLEQTEDDENVYEVLWADNVSPDNPRSNSRFFGLVTKGGLPEVKIDSISPCDDEDEDEEDDGEGDEDEDEEDDGEEEEEEEEAPAAAAAAAPAAEATAVDPAAAASAAAPALMMMGKDGVGVKKLLQKKKKARALLLEEEGKEGAGEGEVTLAIDHAAEWVQLEILEAMALPITTTSSSSSSSSRNVLINARVTNVGEVPLCGISIWVHDFKPALEYWSLIPSSPGNEDEEGREEGPGVKSTDFVTLPTRNSSLAVGQSHYFGVVVEEKGLKEGAVKKGGFPNMVVVRASPECGVKKAAQ